MENYGALPNTLYSVQPPWYLSLLSAYLDLIFVIGPWGFIILNLTLFILLILFLERITIRVFRRIRGQSKPSGNSNSSKKELKLNWKWDKKDKIFIFGTIFILISSAITFVGGYSLSSYLTLESSPPRPQPPVIYKTPDINRNLSDFATGESYFLETIIAISKEEPRYAIAVSRSMKEEGDDVIQNTRASFFDGKWTRNTNAISKDSLEWSNDNIVTSWEENVDASRVLKYDVSANITVNGNQITIPQTTFHNEMPIRALPDYTKFMSDASTIMNINGRSVPAHILHTRIYTPESSGIQFYGSDISAQTSWLAFWDENDNFYHVDVTDVNNPNEIYRSHSLGFIKDSFGTVSTTFKAQTYNYDSNDPQSFTFDLKDLGTVILVDKLDEIDKSIGIDDIWVMGTVTGSVRGRSGQPISGVGIVEYIRN